MRRLVMLLALCLSLGLIGFAQDDTDTTETETETTETTEGTEEDTDMDDTEEDAGMDDTEDTDMDDTEDTEMDDTEDAEMDDTEEATDDAAMDEADTEDAATEDAAATDDAATDAAATVADVVVGSPDHTTLAAAVEAAGLVETLSGAGPFTVFAPTDAAFETAIADLGYASADELLASEDLSSVLTYHVVPSALLAADAIAAVEEAGGTAELETVNGETISVSVVDGAVTINDSAVVSTADLEAGNGVVHVIDAVLVPPME